jgi:hypothetical protein
MVLVVLLLVCVSACKRERALVSIDGVSATVPGDFVPIDEERVAGLRAAASAADATTDVSMVGRNPPDAPLPWMYLQRTAVRPNLPKALQASDVLEGALSEIRLALKEGNLEMVSSTSRVIGDSHEACFVTKSGKGLKVLNHTCLRLWAGLETKRVHMVSVVCLAIEESPEECQRVLDSRVVTVTGAMPLDATLEP